MTADPHTAAHTPPSTPAPAASEPLDAADDPQSLVDRVMREVSELSGMTDEVAAASSIGENDSNEPAGFDLSALEREIESLLQQPTQASTPAGVGAESPGTCEPQESVEMTSSTGPEHTVDASSNAVGADGSDPLPSDELEALAEVLDPSQRNAKPPIASTAFETEPLDPVQREIDAALVDDTNALLDAFGGDLDAALGSVFDPRVLAGQEEDINRALIEAFGSSRLPWRSGEPAVVTNPAPDFSEGPSRAMPPGTPRVELDRQAAPAEARSGAPSSVDAPTPAAPSVPLAATAPVADRPMPPRSFEELGAASIARDRTPEYAGETPFEPAFPAVPIVSEAAVTEIPGVVAPTAEPVQSAAATAPTASIGTPGAPTAIAPPPRPRPPSRIGPLLVRLVRLPLVAAAAPMRALPESARTYTGLVAATLLLMVPLAWWLAHAKAGARGVGPVTFTGAVAAGDGGEAGSE